MVVFEDFIKLSEEEKQAILPAVNKLLDGRDYDLDTVTMMSVDLPFYHGYQFIELADHSVHPVRKNYALYNDIDGETHLWNFSNECVYQLNKQIPIMLDSENIYDYVRFFFAYVGGSQGRFTVVDSIDDIAWREPPPPNAKEVISKMIAPLSLVKENQDGSYVLQSNMMFKTGLFKSHITITQDGFVSMNNEEMLIEDMPVLDEVVGF